MKRNAKHAEQTQELIKEKMKHMALSHVSAKDLVGMFHQTQKVSHSLDAKLKHLKTTADSHVRTIAAAGVLKQVQKLAGGKVKLKVANAIKAQNSMNLSPKLMDRALQGKDATLVAKKIEAEERKVAKKKQDDETAVGLVTKMQGIAAGAKLAKKIRDKRSSQELKHEVQVDQVKKDATPETVSYTHLTLPTIYSV
eukprot:TRINITY_DN3146_c0_g1_i2.p1 TRINITY_DN3146_c0_g1~~TRINITY_DN3146_c0_g1_i2.p1  ORF type:complete len:196 (+),score=59.09 TRINITY_DN3146_c0_g1_i2:216-803(+)